MSNDKTIRIFIYSPSSIVASSLALLFQQDVRFHVLSGNDIELLQRGVRNRTHDVVLIYEQEISKSTYELVDMISCGLNPNAAPYIAVMGKLQNDADLLSLIKLNVTGYINENMNIDDMFFFLSNISKGIPYYSMRVLAPLIVRIIQENDDLFENEQSEASIKGFTERESTILYKLCQGQSATQISEELFLSKSTVKSHLTNIYRKLGVSNRSQALVAAIKLKYYNPAR